MAEWCHTSFSAIDHLGFELRRAELVFRWILYFIGRFRDDSITAGDAIQWCIPVRNAIDGTRLLLFE
jgi:hypothetical protein